MSMSQPILPVFSSHYSLQAGLLTLEEPGKAKPGAPVSVFDLSQSVGLKEVTLCEDRIDGFLEAYKVSTKLGIKLCFGLRLIVCQDLNDKEPASSSTESRVIVWIKGTPGYSDLIRIHNRAWTTGHFTTRDRSYGRIDWRSLKELWTPNLMLGIAFFSGFPARNAMTFSRIVPDLPPLGGSPLWMMREVDSRLPFAGLIDGAIDRYVTQCKGDSTGPIVEVMPVKSVYYAGNPGDFRAYMVRRAIQMRASFDAPEVDHLASDRFSFRAWQELVAAPARAEGVTL